MPPQLSYNQMSKASKAPIHILAISSCSHYASLVHFCVTLSLSFSPLLTQPHNSRLPSLSTHKSSTQISSAVHLFKPSSASDSAHTFHFALTSNVT